tara:strand:+ start:1 stop:1197 length:1197 start_codon:yes stop_codon:yes gene_type:complete
MNIANQGFPATRADLNNALQALVSNSSGTSAPSTTFANQWWYDTTNNKMYIRNEANNAWIEVFTLDQTNNEWQLTTGVVQAKDSDGLALKTDDGTTRLFIKDSDGSIGIGTSSPAYKVEISDGTRTAIINPNSTLDGIFLGTKESKPLVLGTADNERMRIDSSGNLLVGTTDASPFSAPFDGFIVALNDGNKFAMNLGATATSDRTIIRFNNPNGGVGGINTNGSSTVYYTSSDYRLKENVTDVTDGITRVKQLAPKRFNFIADADTTVDGFLAHEAATVVPEAVTGEKDAMREAEYEVSAATGDIYTPAVEATYDDDGNEVSAAVDEVIHSSNVEQPETLEEGQQWRETTAAVMDTRSVPDYQGIDQSKLVPLLTAALQEAIAKIEALETRVAALEG